MKITYKLNNRITMEFDGNDEKELFRELAHAEEIFGIDRCGKCKKPGIKFVVRTAVSKDPKKAGKTYEYFEMRCLNSDCRAKLSFGQHQEGGTLFPKWGEGWQTREEILQSQQNG